MLRTYLLAVRLFQEKAGVQAKMPLGSK